MVSKLSSPYVIRAEQFAAIEDAQAIRSQAQVDASLCLAAAQEEATAIRLTAQAEAAAFRQEQQERIRDEISVFLQTCEDSLADLAFLVARRLIDDIPRDEKLARLVKTALIELPEKMGVVIKVPVAAGASLVASLPPEVLDSGAISVVECPVQGEEGCLIQHDLGQVQLDVPAQLKALWQSATA